MEHTIEQKVAAAILEKSIGCIEIGCSKYDIAPPSTATLILVSEIVSTLPVVRKTSENDINQHILNSVLHYAKDYRAIGDIAAILILGANKLIEEREVMASRKILGVIPIRRKKTVRIDRQKELAKMILENVRPTVLFEVVIQRLQDMEIGSFFAITTSLSEANILKPTREVVH